MPDPDSNWHANTNPKLDQAQLEIFSCLLDVAPKRRKSHSRYCRSMLNVGTRFGNRFWLWRIFTHQFVNLDQLR